MSQALDAAFEDLHEHGYVVVEGVLSPGELKELREVVDSTFDCDIPLLITAFGPETLKLGGRTFDEVLLLICQMAGGMIHCEFCLTSLRGWMISMAFLQGNPSGMKDFKE